MLFNSSLWINRMPYILFVSLEIESLYLYLLEFYKPSQHLHIQSKQ